MAHSNPVSHQNIPPRLLPQKRAIFDGMPMNVRERMLPSEYEKIAKAVSTVESYKVDLKSVIDPDRSRYAMELYELALLTLNHKVQLDYLLEKFFILENNPFMDKDVAKVLIAEMLWGKQQLLSCSNEVEAIKYYEEELRESFVEVMDTFRSPLNWNVSSTSLPVYVRINVLKIPITEAIRAFKMEGWNLLPPCPTYSDHLQKLGYLSEGNLNFMSDFHIPELFVFPFGTSFYQHPGHLNGLFVLQDKGSCLSSYLLNPEPGSTVLDIFAAPGSKTNHIANIMNNKGLIYANDIHPERFSTMNKILGMTDTTCVQPIQGHYLDIKDCNATHILVDPSCSYSGIFSKKEKRDQYLRIKEFNALLTDSLRHILINFYSAKRVVFTTCSVYPEEGERVVDDVLKGLGDSFVLLDLKEVMNNEWMSVGSLDYICGSKCLRTQPEFDLCQGSFIAVFERNYAVTVSPYPFISPVQEKCHMRIAPNGDIVYENNSQNTMQPTYAVNYHHYPTPGQPYQ